MSSPRKGGTEGGGGGENAGSSFLVPAEALSARLLVIIEGLQANPSAIVQLMGAGGGQGGGDEEMKGVGDEEEAIPSVIRLLIKMAGASSAPAKGSSAQNNEQVAVSTLAHSANTRPYFPSSLLTPSCLHSSIILS
eukprot:jgi/Bigna1/127296/aug1.4_g2004